MTMTRRIILVLIVVVAMSSGLTACPSCYGAADGPMIDGMNMAIVAMLGIMGAVLAAISSFFVMMRRRLRRLHSGSSDQSYVNDKGILQWNNS